MNRSYDENAFIKLYNDHSDEIFRYCFIRIKDRNKALDITQDVFFKLWNEYRKNPKKFFEKTSIKAFMFRVARNTLIDATRKKQSIPFSSFMDTETESSVEPVIITNTQRQPDTEYALHEFIEYLELLDAHHKEILIYRYINEYSIPEIAEILQISENATSVRIHRAVEHARNKLKEFYE